MKIFQLIHIAFKIQKSKYFHKTSPDYCTPGLASICIHVMFWRDQTETFRVPSPFPMLTLLGLTGPQILPKSDNFEIRKCVHPGNGGSCTKTRPRFEFVICAKWKNLNCYENDLGFYQKWTTARSFNFRKEANIVICSSMLKVVSFIDICTRHRKIIT